MATKFIAPKDIESNLVEGKYTVIAVAATWCGPCNMMTQMVWDPINKENGDIQVLKIDADEHKEWAVSEKVSGLPTMFIYNGKTKTDQVLSGFLPREQFEEKVRG